MRLCLRRLRLCLRLRGRRPLINSLPAEELLRRQAEWLAPARARLLRRLNIARRRRVLDLGAGYGAVTSELVRRSSGLVVALDRSHYSLCESDSFTGASRLNAEAATLPIQSASFDLVFCQCTLLWVDPLEACLDEIGRVLRPGGALVAIEPDYDGMIEHPPGNVSRHLWLSALGRAGAEPRIGRLLPGLLEERGFTVRVDLFDRLHPPDSARFDFLSDLPLTADESAELARIEASGRSSTGWGQIAHLPFFLVTAEKPATNN